MDNNIVLYGTGCPRCLVLEKKLMNAGISFDKNSDVDAMKELGINAVPVLAVDGQMLNFVEAVRWVNSR